MSVEAGSHGHANHYTYRGTSKADTRGRSTTKHIVAHIAQDFSYGSVDNAGEAILGQGLGKIFDWTEERGRGCAPPGSELNDGKMTIATSAKESQSKGVSVDKKCVCNRV